MGDGLGEQRRDKSPLADNPKNRKDEHEQRTYNQCWVRGRIHKGCPDLLPKEGEGGQGGDHLAAEKVKGKRLRLNLRALDPSV